MGRKTGVWKTSGMAKFDNLVRKAKFVAAYDKQQGFDFVRSALTPPLDEPIRIRVDAILRRIRTLYSNLGSDSTQDEKNEVKKVERALMMKIREIAPDYYDSIKSQND